MNYLKVFSSLVIYCVLLSTQSFAQVTPPKAHFGFNIGDDYHLATFGQTEAYFKKLAEESDRIRYTVIGKTEEGRDQPMLIVTSATNQKNLERYKSIAQQLARAELSETEAKQLAKEGKSVIWIDGGLHSTETVGMHQLIEIAYLLASRNDDETQAILDNCIVLLTHANPDGQDLITNWYMREATPEKRSLSYVPFLYQKYAGHDNNRDFFMLNLKESQNMARQLFIEWNPQVMYNHHQTAPAGAVVAGAPYRDPFNYVFDPLLMSGIESLGAAMSSRLYAENKPGYTQRGGSVFSTWYNGGLRTTTYFHNTIGLLTEIIGGPNPFEIPLVTSRLLPSSDTHNPVIPQTWHFKQSIDYSTSLNYAVMGYGAKYKNELLFNIYRMGKNSIEKGQKDTWSLSPSKIAVIDSAFNKAKRENKELANQRYMPREFMDSLFKNPTYRDPRAFIIPAEQADLNTAIKFLNALSANGVKIHQATQPFSVNGKTYPAKSFVVKTDQAFRPHVLDMFEPQDHPNDFEYPGGPPIAPYDAAGWTLAYLMHVDFDRIMDDFTAPLEALPYGEPIPPIAKPLPNGKFLQLSAKENDSFAYANLLLKNKQKVYRDQTQGDFFVLNNKESRSILETAGLTILEAAQIPNGADAIQSLRIGLWDTYGGSMPSGWMRFLFEKFHYDYEVFYAPDIDKGDLNKRFDVIVLVGGSIPSLSSNPTFRGVPNEMPESLPENYKSMWGRTTVEKSIPQLEKFVREGGHIVTIGNSASLAEHFKLGVENALVDDSGNPLRREVYYTPGSVLTVDVAPHASTYGYGQQMDLYFSNDQVYRIKDTSIKPLLWFASDKVLKSGWSWGEKYLKDGVVAFEKEMDKGKLTVFTPNITFRSQTHGTFKLLLNNLYR
ncbi:M14 family metallopeptidase [Sphingobacterium wenxiniae]|uniref:Zinc carboxypeptidase n=1 Tax=Sphingobacterium wenxiniae TaxID=683125 RepID=A0A1I6TL86_9SPHI|nr:M14 metallopeptidase family protein [Sphingobacterium wenxiniae]SFS89911.1 Zinc carboxypeptidase [Sphingobacterium wenxiniae]